jgi:Secretion system C-terminal sorting domain
MIYYKMLIKKIFYGFVIFSFITKLDAQGAIINEFSNGMTGSQEYIELLIIGSNTSPKNPVDLRGWIFDDNNGQYGLNVGVAAGHFRIAPTCTNLSALPVGSLVIFYNAAERNPLIPIDDPSDANGDKIYVLPHTDICLETTLALPGAASISYLPSTYIASSSTSWSSIGFANLGDAVQLRKPDGTFFHGFSWGIATGNPTGSFPMFPTEMGGSSSFDIDSKIGTNMAYIFNCGNYSSATNFTRQTASTIGNETPGTSNNSSNAKVIAKIKSGLFDYANLSNEFYCQQTLGIELAHFNAIKENKTIKLEWQIPLQIDFKSCNIQKSLNGVIYESLGSFIKQPNNINYTFLDENPFNLGYYRLEMMDNEGEKEYSKTISVADVETQMFTFIPNPVSDYLSISTNKNELNATHEIFIFDGVGRLVKKQKMESDKLTIDFSKLDKGVYLVQINGNNQVTHRKIIKQ